MHNAARQLLLLMFVVFAFAACAEPPAAPSNIIRTMDRLGTEHPGFRRILIIGVAGDYESRALFERTLAELLYNEEVVALAYHTVIGRRPRLTRTALETIITARKFDAVLFTRQQGQEGRDAGSARPTGAAFDLFGYDYEELNRADSIRRAAAITFVTEIYRGETGEKVWSINSLSYENTDATELIRQQAAIIAAQIRADRLVPR